MAFSSETDSTLHCGFQSENYQLFEKIGEGGFGQIYKAKQQSTQQFVAIKFLTLPDALTGDKKRRYIERFHREVDLVGRLNHPNIVRLIDKGHQGELLYAVYEYIEGQSLREYIARSGALAPAFAAEVMASVLDAIAHAHDKGVIHRDIKPANIMLYEVGATTHAKVLDFGIGTLRHEARQLDYKSITLTQETLGTPSYSAPEQLRGEPPLPQTDIYVWGLVFLECLSGQPAISGSSLAAVFHQQLSPSNVPLGILAGHDSANLLRSVLSKKAHERPANSIELYHRFKKLNFSNLVGHLALPNSTAMSASDTTYISDETDVFDARLSYTRLTERKQVSVLSVIISTEQDLSVSSEDSDVIDTLHTDQVQQCIDIAVRYGAYHVGHLGDTLLFYFGYPQASENDARLCARTALEMISNIRKKSALLKQTQGLIYLAQVGINTGVMLSLANNAPEGKVAHDAMKICRQAAPNQILCTESVKQLLDVYLDFESQASVTSSALSGQPIFSLRGERQVEAFGFLRGVQKNQAFIGRAQELQALQSQLVAAESNGARLVHVQGEAGIGKSRLVFEFRHLNPQLQFLVAQCLPEHRNNALYPILNLLRFKYSLDAVTPEQAVATLEKNIDRLDFISEHREQGKFVLLAWLSLPLPEDNAAMQLPPEMQKQRLFTLIAYLLCQPAEIHDSAEHSPQHVFIFEDMHWADPTSLAFIAYLVTADVFINGAHGWLTLSRESVPPELADQHFHHLAVAKLNAEDTAAFTRYLFDNQPVAAELMTILLERTDGIPLFVEELVSSLKKQKIVHKINGEFNFVDKEKQALIPLSLRDSLQQKLDQLPHAKDSAQLAATIGREFNYELLMITSEKDEALLQSDLESLIAAELIYRQRKVDGDSYIFKHALVRDAAYDSMPLANKKYAHEQVAQALISQTSSTNNATPVVIATHFAHAEKYQQASQYGLLGIKHAVKSSSNVEAISLYELLEGWAQKLTTTALKLLFQLLATEAVLPAKLSLFGYGAEQVRNLTQQANTLIEKIRAMDVGAESLHILTALGIDNVEDYQQALEEIFFKITWAEYLFEHYKPNREQALKIGDELLQRYDITQSDQASRDNNRQKYMTVKLHLAQNYMTLGKHHKAATYYQEAYDLYDESLDLELAAEYGTDAKSQNLSLSAEVDLMFGQLDRAYDKLSRALQHAEKIGHNTSIIFAHIVIAQVAAFDKDYEKVIAITKDYQANYGNTPSYFECYLYLYYYCAIDDTESALAALEQQSNTGQLFAISYYVTHLADAYLRNNQIQTATEFMEFWLQSAKDHDDIGALPFLMKTLAECYFKLDGKVTQRVEQLLLAAIKAAKQQQAHYFELENSVFLCSLYQQEGRDHVPEFIDIPHVLALTEQLDIRQNSELQRAITALKNRQQAVHN